MVKSFRTGPLWDMNALKDLQTPYIWCEEAQSRITIGNGSHKTGLYTFRLYCMDRIQKDQSNYQEILSDTKFILDTIITELDQHPLFIQLGLSIDQGDVVFEPVYEETDVNANGHMVEFTFRYPIRYTPCNVPIDALAGYTFSLNNNVFQYSVVGVPGPQGATGTPGAGAIGNNDVGVMYLKNNSIPTIITTINERKVVEGTMSVGTLFNFIKDPSTNSLKYTGPGGRFHIIASFNFSGGSRDIYGFYIGKNTNPSSSLDPNADRISESEIYVNSNQANDQPAAGIIQTVLDLNTNDRVFFIVQNRETTADITVEFLKYVVTSLTAEKGETGPQGLQGITGPQGFQGDIGPQGDQGPQGDVGATGANGQSTSYYNYKANTISLSGDPGSGYILWDDPNPVVVKTINISHINNDGVDIDIFLALIKSGDILILQDTTNSNRYQRYIVGDPPVLQTGYVQYDVDNQFSNITFNNDDPVTLFIITQGTPGPQGATGSQGTTGPQGLEGPIGATGYEPVFNISSQYSLYYNSADIVDPPNFTSINESFSDGDGIYLTRGNLTLVENISNPLDDRITITTDTLSGLGSFVWTIPAGSDTFVGKDTTQLLSNKTFNFISINPNGVTSSKGDLFYTQTNGGFLTRLQIGGTGSILGATNDIPTWITPGTFSSVLTIQNGIPTWKKRNFIKVTDGTGVTGSGGVNLYTDGVLIPANSVSAGDVLELRSRIRKTGTGGTVINRLYIGVNNSLVSANLVGLSTTMGNTTLTGQMVRTLVVKSATQSEVYPVTQAALNDDNLNSAVAVATYNIDWTLDQYFVSSVQNSVGGDSTRSSFLQVKIFE
jgi:hypothetical protein